MGKYIASLQTDYLKDGFPDDLVLKDLMENPTVFTAVSHDRVIRMALFPMDRAPPKGWFGGRVTFPFYVAWKKTNSNSWRTSCRTSGLDFLGGSRIGSGSDIEAIRWLLSDPYLKAFKDRHG